MPVRLKGAVGRRAGTGRVPPNYPADVRNVQTLLRIAHQRMGTPTRLIAADGTLGPMTMNAIKEFQTSRWGTADVVVEPDGQTLHALNQAAEEPITTVLQPGDTSKATPFTILFIANPVLETVWNEGGFAVDPITSDQVAFDACVRYAAACLLGDVPGQAERLLGDPTIRPRVRILSSFQIGLPPEDRNALVAHDGVSSLLIARRQVFVPFLDALRVQADVVYAISQSATHNRASAWFTSDNDAGPGLDFTLDGVTRSHRFYNLIPGTVAMHATARSLTPLHEFGHALSSYTNGALVDLYVDSEAALNNRRGRPIPGSFASYSGIAMGTDGSRGGIGYPSTWQSYHCELIKPESPCAMDNYYLAPQGALTCVHDRITRAFLKDRLRAKLGR